MKKSLQPLTPDDVRNIIDEKFDEKFRETGLDQVSKRLNTLDKILTSVDGIAGEMKAYREEQELNANKLAGHEDQLEKHTKKIGRIEKHLHLVSP